MMQDNSNDLIWETWGGEWRDVMIVDKDNQLIGQYNLTENNLSDQNNYDELKGLLLEVYLQ